MFDDLWQMEAKVDSTEINLYTKKLQYLNNLINESYRDVIFCAAICIIPTLVQFFISNLISSTVRIVSPQTGSNSVDLHNIHPNLAFNYDMLGEYSTLFALLDMKQMGVSK